MRGTTQMHTYVPHPPKLRIQKWQWISNWCNRATNIQITMTISTKSHTGSQLALKFGHASNLPVAIPNGVQLQLLSMINMKMAKWIHTKLNWIRNMVVIWSMRLMIRITCVSTGRVRRAGLLKRGLMVKTGFRCGGVYAISALDRAGMLLRMPHSGWGVIKCGRRS